MADKNVDKVIFSYMKKTIKVNCNSTDKLEIIFKKFISSINENYNLNEFDFYYNDKILDDYSKSLKQIIVGNDDIIIFPERKLRIIKCPECNCNDSMINIDNYQIVFYGCCRQDHISYKLLDEYDESQRVKLSKIKCSENSCKKNMENAFQDFYICMDCTKENKHTYYLCNEHNLIEDHATHVKKRYDDKHYYCEDHFEKLIEYCFNCNKNLCSKCLKQHEGNDHKLKSYESLIPDLNNVKGKLNEIKEKIGSLKSKIGDIKKKLDGALIMYENYYKIANDIIQKYEFFNKEFKNYRILRSFLNLKKSNKKIYKDLKDILEGLEGEKKNEKIGILIKTYETDRAIYNDRKLFKSFSPKDGIEELKEWEEENAIKELKQQNTLSNNGKKKWKKKEIENKVKKDN